MALVAAVGRSAKVLQSKESAEKGKGCARGNEAQDERRERQREEERRADSQWHRGGKEQGTEPD